MITYQKKTEIFNFPQRMAIGCLHWPAMEIPKICSTTPRMSQYWWWRWWYYHHLSRWTGQWTSYDFAWRLPTIEVNIAGLHRVAGGGSTESRSPIILACGSLFVHDGCTFYGFGSPNYQGSTFVIMWDHEVILLEQDLCTSRQGRLNFPFCQTTLGMVAGTRKGISS